MKDPVYRAGLLGIVFLGLIDSVYGQTDIQTNAVITVPITAQATAPLTFGEVIRGTTKTIGANSSSAGACWFSGDEQDQVSIAVPATTTLHTTSGAGADMTVSINQAGVLANTANNQGAANAIDASSGTATTNLSSDATGDEANNDGLGQVFLWFGGSVTAAATQQRGSYTGTFIVSATYTN